MKHIMIMKNCKQSRVKKGEVYETEPYQYDPNGKVVLLARVPDGYCPDTTEYNHNVKFL